MRRACGSAWVFWLGMAVLAAWPRPAGAVDANGPWGVHPHCIAPAIPLEAESWWLERDERVPKHLHLAACVPNARTADCSDPANPRVTRRVPFTSRVTSFNNRGPINWIRWSWQSDVRGKLRTDWRCEPAGVEHPECGWMGDMTLDPAEGNGGLDELRLSPNIAQNEFDKRQFATLNAQVCTGASSEHHRSRPDPIARGWYEGVDYSNVRVDYMRFFESLGETIPTVSGVVSLDVDHQKGSGTTRSLLWLDVVHHRVPELFASPPPAGVALPSGGMLLYNVPGLFDGIYRWDTRRLANGVHVLFFQTASQTSAGTSVGGLKLLFNVKN